MTTLTMQAPTSAYTQVSTRNGLVYYSDPTGLVSNVDSKDVVDLLNAGWTIVGPGYGLFRVPLLNGKNSDGSVLAAAAAAGKFGIAITPGTSFNLVSEAANNNTKTDTLVFDIQMPASFPSGRKPDIVINQAHVIGSGTLGTHTWAAHLYSQNDDGTQGADIVSTSAQNTTASATELTFHTSAGLQPNQRVTLTIVLVLQESASSNVTAKLNSVRFV